MLPSYTIAIPVFERTFGFEESILSAIAVTGCNEIMVVDDCSSHRDFEKICLNINAPQVKYIRNAKNLGIFGNWNKCVELASSDFVSILCSDDIIEPDIYSRFITALTNYHNLDVFFGSFTEYYNSINEAITIRSYLPGPISGQELLEDAADNGAAFPVLSVIRRSKLLKYPYLSKPHSGNDWLWIYSNALKLNFFADSKPLSYWRRHPNQDSRTSQSITTDCWPLMYLEISAQLEKCQSAKSSKAFRRALGVILSWLVNDKSPQGYWHKRFQHNIDINSNSLIVVARKLVDQNWLLIRLLKSNKMWPLYYYIGRIYRKLGIYPAPV